MKRASTVEAPSVPIVMPTVDIRIDESGSVTVTIDTEPYEVESTLGRGDVRRLVQELANTYGPIRVVIVEADGEAYVDIETPRGSAHSPGPDSPSASRPSSGPFRPSEVVLAAVVVDKRTAGSSGNVSLQVPPAIAQRYGGAVYLIGQTSRVVLQLSEIDGKHG